MYRILKDEVHVSLLTGEKVFLDSLDNRGSFENAVLTMIPERIVKLCPGMKQTQKSYQPSDDLEFEPCKSLKKYAFVYFPHACLYEN